MRQAIQTKYLGPTDHHGARIKAWSEAGSITVPWDDAHDVDKNHTRAAVALAMRLNWRGKWLGGAVRDGYVFVTVEVSQKPDFVVR